MKGGDISGISAPRILMVFEGIIGELPTQNIKDWKRHVKEKQWERAVQCWILSPLALAKVIDLTRRMSVNIEVITYAAGPEFAEALETYLVDTENVPVRKVLASTPDRTARRATFAMDITAVYDTDPQRVMQYGSKGRHLTSIHNLGR